MCGFCREIEWHKPFECIWTTRGSRLDVMDLSSALNSVSILNPQISNEKCRSSLGKYKQPFFCENMIDRNSEIIFKKRILKFEKKYFDFACHLGPSRMLVYETLANRISVHKGIWNTDRVTTPKQFSK